MKQVFGKKGKIVVEEVPAPVCRDNGLLVETICSLISPGTEVHSIKSRQKSIIMLAKDRPDLVKKVLEHAKKAGLQKTRELVKSRLADLTILGYSSAGIVREVGKNITEFSVGDRVACAGAQYANHAEYIYVPKNLAVKIPDNVSFEEAAFTTVGSIAMQGVRRADVKLGEYITVVGLGLIGLLSVQILKAAGCRVLGIDLDPKRASLAKSLGADAVVVPTKKNPLKEVLRFTKGMGADAVIITAATKSDAPVNQAMQMCRKKGRVVVVGDVGMNIQRETFYKKEIDFLISTSYGPGRYDSKYEDEGSDYPVGYVRWTENRNMQAFVELLSKNAVNVKPLISAAYPIEQAQKAYSSIGKGMITSLFTYAKNKRPERKIQHLPAPRTKEKINVALIGAGNYAKAQHLPNLKALADYKIYGIVTHNGRDAKQIAEQYSAVWSSSDYRDALRDKNIDLVIVSTRHGAHAQITIDAANAKKDVFVEKPMALNEKEMNGVVRAVQKNKINYMIGFNRRFSPFAVEAKKILKSGHGPYVIHYTVNAGTIPKEHWIYDSKEGGGRIIGEGCHFFDMFNFFTESKSESITAVSVNSCESELVSEDNVSATIKYTDGSVAHLLYLSNGAKDMPKERIEISRGGISCIINDYKELKVFGASGSFKTGGQDKGQLNQLKAFAKAIKGEETAALSLEECALATKISFEVAKKIKEAPV